jgi:predicted RNase H-like nuclease
MPWIAGVDGCRAGWVVVLAECRAAAFQVRAVQLCSRFADILNLHPAPMVIAVDIPIGLLDQPQSGGRTCDRQARSLLGHRASSVFSPPSRLSLEATEYEQVRTHGMSRQAFGILPKIREVDQVMTPALQDTVYEAHPELAFMALAGQPMQHNKKTFAGREERLRALTQTVNISLQRLKQATVQALEPFKRSQVAPDDLLDAYILLRTAWRIVNAEAGRVPSHPPVDTLGLRMEIWF